MATNNTNSNGQIADVRDDSVQLAVKFLLDPNVQSAAVSKKMAFLESKGLTAAEIEEAMKRASSIQPLSSSSAIVSSNPGSFSSSQVPPVPRPTYGAVQALPPQSDWRDYLLGTIGAVGFAYGAYQLFVNYVIPTLVWPSNMEQEENQKKLETKLESLSTSLEAATATIQEQTAKMRELLDQSILEQEKNADEMKAVKEEVESIKSLIPMVYKSHSTDSVSMSELQSELRSLKSLLLNRKSFPPVPTVSSIPSAYQSKSASGNSLGSKAGDTASGDDDATMVGASHDVDSFLGKFTSGKPSIPSWQLASKPAVVVENVEQTGSQSGSQGGYSVNVGSAESGEEDEKEDDLDE